MNPCVSPRIVPRGFWLIMQRSGEPFCGHLNITLDTRRGEIHCPDCSRTFQKCESQSCNIVYGVGIWPSCPHGIPGGMLGEFHPYIDEHVSAVGPVEIRSLADRKRHLRDTTGRGFRLEEVSRKRGMPGQEI